LAGVNNLEREGEGMKIKIIGYIVTHDNWNRVMELCKGIHYPKGGVLLHGDSATLFADRRKCHRAIQRTIRYRIKELKEKSVNVSHYQYTIVPVRLEAKD
jgi:hypothetical protein